MPNGTGKLCMSETDARIFWDTNVWVYLFDAGSPKKQDRIRRLLKQEHNLIFSSTQVLQELYVTLTRKLAVPLEEERAAEILPAVSEFCTVSVDIPMIQAAADLSRRHSFSFWDALIVEAAASGSATILYSEDLQDSQTIRGLTVRNPFS